MRYYLVVFICGLTISCSNKNAKKSASLPVCLVKQIELFDKKESNNPPEQIDEYLYNDKRVFLFTAGCCDQYNTVYDEQCNAICSPSGGFEGKGDHKCEEFSKKARFIKKIWPTEKK